MVQKEVAERLTAKVSSKSYGRLSVLLQLHCNVRKYFDVDRDKFVPKPKVVSTVIQIKPKKQCKFIYEKVDKLLRHSFKQRRKTIKNNLKTYYIDVEKKILKCGIDPNSRPQDLEPNDFVKLSKILI